MAATALVSCGVQTPAIIEFVEVQPAEPRLGEVLTVRFRLIDERGIQLAGVPVDFRLETPNNAVKLSPTTSLSIKGTGIVETQLVVASRVTSVIVVATAGEKTVRSPPISFAGAVPNGRQFTFQCGQIAGEASGGRHAIGAYDATRNLIAGVKLNCTAHVGDRNGNSVPGALVSFLVEAGTVGPTEVSRANIIGDATILYKTSYPLPAETNPITFNWTLGAQTNELAAPLWMLPWQWKPNPADTMTMENGQEPRRPDGVRRAANNAFIQNNPRDNLVTMIAVVSGEEGFNDLNNDGVAQANEFDPAFDLAEPFVDANDSGTWEANERFIDVNGNGVWDPKDGQWNGNTLLWTMERVLWTGVPGREDTAETVAPGTNPTLTRPLSVTAFVCPGSPGMDGDLCSQAGPQARVEAYLADPWYNALAQNGESDGCGKEDEEKGLVVASFIGGTSGVALTYPAGRRYPFYIKDARNPERPADQLRRRARPPLNWSAGLKCTFTSSPVDGYRLTLGVGVISGTIE